MVSFWPLVYKRIPAIVECQGPLTFELARLIEKLSSHNVSRPEELFVVIDAPGRFSILRSLRAIYTDFGYVSVLGKLQDP